MSVGVGSSATVIHLSFRFGMTFDLSLTSDDLCYHFVIFDLLNKKVNGLTSVRPSHEELSEVKTWHC